MIDVLYFSWLRERIGTHREKITTNATTVSELIDELSLKSEGHALAFQDRTSLRVAIDQELSAYDAKIGQAREIAFFPPMTGG